MSVIYNEIEPYAVQWLRSLEAAEHIAHGTVNSRSIVDLQYVDVANATQAHFFAGIGVWSHSLRLAGWPDDAPVWTGSCPCQPFSQAGKKTGVTDARHLWPEWFRLIEQCRPPIIFGEQVASPDGLGWLDVVSADLEGAGYSVGAADLCAAGVGAPHIRQRLYFVAYRDGVARGQRCEVDGGSDQRGDAKIRTGLGRGGRSGELGNSYDDGTGWDGGSVPGTQAEGQSERLLDRSLTDSPDVSGATSGFWADAEWVPCTDGKYRPTQPGVSPLAHGTAARVGKLRAYGNAIVPQVASTFIMAAMDVLV